MNFDELEDSVWEIIKDGPDEISINAVIVFVIRQSRIALIEQVQSMSYEEHGLELQNRQGYEQAREQVIQILKGVKSHDEMKD